MKFRFMTTFDGLCAVHYLHSQWEYIKEATCLLELHQCAIALTLQLINERFALHRTPRSCHYNLAQPACGCLQRLVSNYKGSSDFPDLFRYSTTGSENTRRHSMPLSKDESRVSLASDPLQL